MLGIDRFGKIQTAPKVDREALKRQVSDLPVPCSHECCVVPLGEDEAEQIKRVAAQLDEDAMQQDDVNGSGSSDGSEAIIDSSSNEHEDPASSDLLLRFKLTVPATRQIFINDLFGLDEPIVRVATTEFLAGGELSIPATNDATFNIHVSSNFLADFFDSKLNVWKPMLMKDLETTLRISRSLRVKSERLSTWFDVECTECSASFSEQLLVNAAAASQTWSIYSAALSSATENVQNSILMRRKASSAARTSIVALPYAIDNYCGVDAAFILPGGKEEIRQCFSGYIQYFRFEPPQGSGVGKKRVYGQDAVHNKSVTLIFGDSRIEVDCLDLRVGQPRRAFHLRDGRVVCIKVMKEGKTTVGPNNFLGK